MVYLQKYFCSNKACQSVKEMVHPRINCKKNMFWRISTDRYIVTHILNVYIHRGCKNRVKMAALACRYDDDDGLFSSVLK